MVSPAPRWVARAWRFQAFKKRLIDPPLLWMQDGQSSEGEDDDEDSEDEEEEDMSLPPGRKAKVLPLPSFPAEWHSGAMRL